MTKEEIRSKIYDMPLSEIINWIEDLEEIKKNFYLLSDKVIKLLEDTTLKGKP